MDNFVVKVTNEQELKKLEEREPRIKGITLNSTKKGNYVFPMLYTFDANGNISFHASDKEKFLSDVGYLIVRPEI